MAPLFTGRAFGFGRSAADASPTLRAKATGGNQTPSNGLAPGNGYIYHTFTSTGSSTFTVLDPTLTTVELLLVGGGSAGATGGGGAGALIYRTSVPVSSSPGSYPITVGAGGVQPAAYHNDGPNYLGQPSTALGFTAVTGGWGGAHTFSDPFIAGGPGGSGGGGAPKNGGGAPYPGGSATGAAGGTPGSVSPPVGWGNPGSAPPQGPGVSGPGGGGGGAGGAGSGTNGGSGLTYTNFAGPLIGFPALPGTYAAGGGGNGGSAGDANTGNGGAGWVSGVGVSGGSGIVVIRYLA